MDWGGGGGWQGHGGGYRWQLSVTSFFLCFFHLKYNMLRLIRSVRKSRCGKNRHTVRSSTTNTEH